MARASLRTSSRNTESACRYGSRRSSSWFWKAAVRAGISRTRSLGRTLGRHAPAPRKRRHWRPRTRAQSPGGRRRRQRSAMRAHIHVRHRLHARPHRALSGFAWGLGTHREDPLDKLGALEEERGAVPARAAVDVRVGVADQVQQLGQDGRRVQVVAERRVRALLRRREPAWARSYADVAQTTAAY